VWDDTVTAIATRRLEHAVTVDMPGLGDAAGGEGHRVFMEWLAETRLWLADTERLAVAPTIERSVDAMCERLDQLEELLATCPADVRPVIAQLHAGQLTLDATNDLLHDALDQQDARRDWIITNWPSIVEHHEIGRALEHLTPTITLDPAVGFDLDL